MQLLFEENHLLYFCKQMNKIYERIENLLAFTYNYYKFFNLYRPMNNA